MITDKKCFYCSATPTHMNYYGVSETFLCERHAQVTINQRYGRTVRIDKAAPRDKSLGAYSYLMNMVGRP